MENNLVKIFSDLCAIPSPSGQEDNVRNYILNKLSGIIDSHFTDKAGNLLITIKGTKAKALLLCAHMDTVSPAGIQKAVIKNGIIYGNGKNILGADNKTGVAAIICLILSLEKEKLPYPNLEILFTTKEETEGGIQQFPKGKIKAKQCIMSDLSAPIGSVLVSAPFVGGYGITVSTNGSHVKKFTKETFHPLQYFLEFNKKITIGKIAKDTIINIGITRMGENYNNIPNSIYFTGEIRTFSKKKYISFVTKLQNTVNLLNKKFHTKADFQFFPYCDGFTLKNNDLNLLKQAMKKNQVILNPISGFGVGDENTLAKWGIKTLNIGDGSVDCHTLKEHIAVNDLERLFYIYKDYLLTFS